MRDRNPWIANEEIDVVLDAVFKSAKLVSPWFRFRLFLNDPKDDLYIECDLAAAARTIVTSDRHFDHQGRAFCRRVQKKGPTIMSTYPLRLADHVMEEAKQAAAEDNVSLNQLLSAFIADSVGHRRAIPNLKKRAARGNAEAALAILERAPGVAPDPGTSLLMKENRLA